MKLFNFIIIYYVIHYRVFCQVCKIIITHAPLFQGGAAYVYESPLGDSCLVMNIHNPFMHCVTSQYVFKLCDAIIPNNLVSIATIKFATASPSHIPLNGMFHQDSAIQLKNCEFKRLISLLCPIHYTSTISIPFEHNMYMIKVRMPRCVCDMTVKCIWLVLLDCTAGFTSRAAQ